MASHEYRLNRATRIVERTKMSGGDGKKYKIYVPQQRLESMFSLLFRSPDKRWRDLTKYSFPHTVRISFATLIEAEAYLAECKSTKLRLLEKPGADVTVAIIE